MKDLTRIFVLISILYSYQAKAQQICIKGGLNLSNMLFENENDEQWVDDPIIKSGFHTGLTFDIPLDDFLSLESGVFVTTKGANWSTGYSKDRLDLYYLDIPLTLNVFHVFDGGLRLYGKAGPYADMGLTITQKTIYGDETIRDVIPWKDIDKSQFKRFDMGLILGGGIEIHSFLVEITYDLGIYNIYPDPLKEYLGIDTGIAIRNRVLKITVGYRL